jgi:hypothetical protein
MMLLYRLYHKIIRQLEAHNGFCWYVNIPVAGQSRCRGSGATAHQTANNQSDTAASHAAYEHAKPSTSANQGG